MENFQATEPQEPERHLAKLLGVLRDGCKHLDIDDYYTKRDFLNQHIRYFEEFYYQVGKDFVKDDNNLLPFRETYGLSGVQVRLMCKGKTPESLLEPESSVSGPPKDPLVDELVHKANEEIREFVRKVLSGEVVLTDDKLQECIGYIKRKLVLAQLSLSIEANSINNDIGVASLVRVQAQSIKTQIDSLEQTMKLLIGGEGEESSLIETSDEAKEI